MAPVRTAVAAEGPRQELRADAVPAGGPAVRARNVVHPPGPLVTTRFLTTSSWTVEVDLPSTDAIERRLSRRSSPCSIAPLSSLSSLRPLFLLAMPESPRSGGPGASLSRKDAHSYSTHRDVYG